MDNNDIDKPKINVNELLQKKLDLNPQYSEKFLNQKKRDKTETVKKHKEEYNSEFEDEEDDDDNGPVFSFVGTVGGTIEEFLKIVCEPANVRKQLHGFKSAQDAEIKVLNENEGKIKDIVNCIVALDKNTIASWLSSEKNGYPIFDGFDELLQYKTYMILCLIHFGINPFTIKKYLGLKSNNDFNWNNLCEVIEKNPHNWLSVCEDFLYNTNDVRLSVSIAIVKLINIFEDLLNPNNDSHQVNIQAVSAIINNQPVHAFLRFIWFFLNNNIQKTNGYPQLKEFLLGITDGVIFRNFFSQYSQDTLSKNKDKKELTLTDLSYSSYEFPDFQSNFYNLIENLDSVMIGVFCLILMKKISFTDEQMDFIAQKINNDSVMTILRQINQSLDYKSTVEFGPVTRRLNYIFMKIFRGIGHLGALLWAFLHFIPYMIGAGGLGFVFACLFAVAEFTPLGYGIFFFWSNPFWICFGVLTGMFVIVAGVYYALMKSKFGKWWSDFADDMENIYQNSKIVYWLQLYNIKNPTNNIGLPPQQIIGVSGDLHSVGSNGQQVNESNIPTISGNDIPKKPEDNNNISEL